MSDTVAAERRAKSSAKNRAKDAADRMLSPDELYEALAHADGDELVALADRILNTPSQVELTAGPSVVSSPVRLSMPGDAGTVVVGHVAMTTCEVSLDGVRGDGIRSGRSLEASIAAAICDAEVERRGACSNDVFELAHSTLRDLHAKGEQRARETQLTRLGDSE